MGKVIMAEIFTVLSLFCIIGLILYAQVCRKAKTFRNGDSDEKNQ